MNTFLRDLERAADAIEEGFVDTVAVLVLAAWLTLALAALVAVLP